MQRTRVGRVSAACATALAAGLLSLACASTGGPGATVVPLRLTEVQQQGDPARRASSRLVIEGLEADVEGRAARARGLYDRALQVDPTNPYAYLALARHEADGLEPARALAPLEQARLGFAEEGGIAPEVEVHLIGLEGVVLYATGRVDEGVRALEEARLRAPEVWSDGRLDASELR